MNRKRKLQRMQKIIKHYGTILAEYKRPADSCYRKGSYFASFQSEKLGLSCSIGHINKYEVYKSIVECIKEIQLNPNH